MSVSERLARHRARQSQAAPQGPPGAAESTIAPASASGMPPEVAARMGRPAPWWLEALPAAGGLAGGIIGGAGGTVGGFGVGGVPGAIGGTALGTAGGEALSQLGARALGYDAPETPQEAAGRIGEAGRSGAIAGAIPAVGGRVAGMLAKAPILRQLPGAGLTRRVMEDVSEIGSKIRGGKSMPIPAPRAVKAAGDALDEGGEAASEAGRRLAQRRWGQKPEVIKGGKSPGEQRIAKLKEGESAPGRAKRLKQRQKDNRRHPQMQQQPQIETPPLGGELRRAIEAEKWMAERGVTPQQRIEILRRLAQGE